MTDIYVNNYISRTCTTLSYAKVFQEYFMFFWGPWGNINIRNTIIFLYDIRQIYTLVPIAGWNCSNPSKLYGLYVYHTYMYMYNWGGYSSNSDWRDVNICFISVINLFGGFKTEEKGKYFYHRVMTFTYPQGQNCQEQHASEHTRSYTGTIMRALQFMCAVYCDHCEVVIVTSRLLATRCHRLKCPPGSSDPTIVCIARAVTWSWPRVTWSWRAFVPVTLGVKKQKTPEKLYIYGWRHRNPWKTASKINYSGLPWIAGSLLNHMILNCQTTSQETFNDGYNIWYVLISSSMYSVEKP